MRVPSILQLENAECGAACLGMVLATHGRHVGLEELRVACGVSRDGASARQLLVAARSYGLETKAFRREPDALRAMSFPLIVHWQFFHFVVVEGWFDGGWYLNDPATGPRPCTDREFAENFTGIVLEARPGDGFEKGGERPGVVRRVMRLSGDTKGVTRLVGAASALLLVPTLVVPLLMRSFGTAISTQDGAGLDGGVTVLGLVLALLVTGGVLAVQGEVSVRFSARVSSRVTASMVDRLLHLPASFHAQRGAVSMTQRALVAERLSDSVAVLLVTVVARALTVTVGAVVLVAVDPLAGAVTIALSLASGALARLALVRSRDLASSLIVETIEAGTVVGAALSQIESIKASGNDEGMIALGRARQTRLLVAQQRIGVRSTVLTTLTTATGALATLAVAVVAAMQVQHGSVSAGTLLAVMALSAIVINPVAQIVAALDQAHTLRAALDQVDDVLNAPFADDSMVEGEYPVAIRGELDLVGVSFGYARHAAPIVSDLTLHVPAGARVALVGPSGSGKSTASRLVTGLYVPWSGEVRIDGLPRERHSAVVLADRLALVDQDVSIFAGTVRDNVTLWDSTVPERDVLDAIRDAQLADDVARRPGGLDAVLAEGGADLSGGQRQRLEIARALVRNPALIVLDEATSALDTETEQRIDEAIRRRGITCLIIAHRLSTIRDCDQIVVLDRGSIAERGTHAELMARDSVYARLVESL